MDLEVIRARLVADTSQFVAELEKAKGTLAGGPGDVSSGAKSGLGRTAISADHALRTVRRSMIGLASDAANVPGPIGRITEALIGLEASTGVLIAIGAAVAVFAIAMHKASEASENLTKSLAANQQVLQKQLQVIHGLASQGQESGPARDLERLRTAIKVTKDALDAMGSTVARQLGGAPTAEENALASRLKLMQVSAQELATTLRQDTVRAVEQAQFAFFNFTKPLTEVTDALKVQRLEWAGWRHDEALNLVALEREAEEWRGLANDMRRIRDIRPSIQRPGLGLRGVPDPKGLRPAIPDEDVLNLRLQLLGAFDNDELRRRLQALGVSLGRQFTMGLIEGIGSLEDLVKTVISSLFDFALGEIFGALFSPGGGVGGLVKDFSKSPAVGPASMQLSLGTLQPMTTWAVARDPAFQQLLREGVLVSRAQGFRG